MITEDVYFLTGDYISVVPPVVRLWGKTRDGRSCVVFSRNFEPYFYVSNYNDNCETFLRDSYHCKRFEKTTLKLNCRTSMDVLKVTTLGPWMVPGLRAEMVKRGATVYAADILFHRRWIYDEIKSACATIRGEERNEFAWDVDVCLELVESTSVKPFSPPLTTLSFDMEWSSSSGKIYCIGWAAEVKGKEEQKGCISLDDEKSTLLEFERLYKKISPDIITGWNITGADLEVLTDRFNIVVGRDFCAGRDGSPFRERKQADMGKGNRKKIANLMKGLDWKCRGRVIIDGMWAAKIRDNPERLSLSYCSQKYIGDDKLDLDAAKIDQYWKENREKVIEYCTHDAWLPLPILKELRVIQFYTSLSIICNSPMEDTMSNSSSVADGILVPRMDAEKFAVPMSGKKKEDEYSWSLPGAYVHPPVSGLHEMVGVIDFASMYPSHMIASNLCYTTMVGTEEAVVPDEERVVDIAVFVPKEEYVGIIPRIQVELKAIRDQYKHERDISQTDADHEFYDDLQGAVKIVMNMIYGLFSSDTYRLARKPIGAHITVNCKRKTIEKIGMVEENGFKVVLSDTDSVYFKLENGLEKAIEEGNRLAEITSEEGMMMEFEKIYSPFFNAGVKKRYFGRVVYKDGKHTNKLDVKGLEIKRTDGFPHLSSAMGKVIDHILDMDIDGAKKSARSSVREIMEREVEDLNELVISRNASDPKTYKNPFSIPAVQAALKMKKRKYPIKWGYKISYIVTDSNCSPICVEPVIEGVEIEEPDWTYYAEREARALQRIVGVWGWEMRDLMFGKQRKMEEFYA